MQRNAFAGTVCLPKSQRCKIPEKEKKRKVSIDLNRWAASRASNFLQSRHYRPRDTVETLRARALFAQRRHRLAGISADANARIDFHFAQHRDAISDRGLRALAVAKNVHRLAAVRARKRA